MKGDNDNMNMTEKSAYHNLVNFAIECFLAGNTDGDLEAIFTVHNLPYNQLMVNEAVTEAEDTLRLAGAIS